MQMFDQLYYQQQSEQDYHVKSRRLKSAKEKKIGPQAVNAVNRVKSRPSSGRYG